LDRNLLIAFTLSFLVLITWQSFVHPPPKKPAVVEAEQGQQAQGTESEAKGPEPAAGASAEATPEAPAQRFGELPGEPVDALPEVSRTAAEPDAGLPAGTEIRIDEPLYDATLTSRGGALEFWELHEYDDAHGDPVVLVRNGDGPGAVGVTPFLELGLGDLSRKDWQVVSEGGREVGFALEEGGISVRKTWEFDADSYSFRLRLDVTNGTDAVVAPRFLVDWPVGARGEQEFKQQGFVVLQDGKVQRKPLASAGSAGITGWITGAAGADHYDYDGDIDWAGVETTYFVSALLPDTPKQANARIAVIERSKLAATQLYYDAVSLPPGQSLTREYRGYVGPKEPTRLDAMGSGLDGAIDLGWTWFAPLTRGFGWLLGVLYSVIPNYGIAIILLTILVRGVTAPLTVKQMRSMERLRRVQPQMKAIQEKYKDDRQKQSEELMRLYRLEKVNPLGGCFPMVLQLPVFIGLFYALRSSIALRHAPFFGWIHDLSAPEMLFALPGLGLPVRVLPLVMGATMFLQQKITPMQTPDPAQAKMMMTVMPIMMTVLFYQFPSGLVLYWMLSNMLAILHQLWIGRKMGPPGTPAQSGSPEPKAA
jgi:YidC/Oxa1 family membrane protein insertase